jgi:alpha-L-fucosidase
MYQPTLESVKTHPLPDWYAEAKFGIFIHWGLYSVPAFAPRLSRDINTLLASGANMGSSPYAEWYQNSMRVPGSPTHKHHLEKYGQDFSYEQFAPLFKQQTQAWQPDSWADLFQRAGARYVVLTSKHHDGFLLWPSDNPNPRRSGYQSQRDLVGELTQCVQERGMRMGLYYSSLLDWTFTERPIRRLGDLMTIFPTSLEYQAYSERHWLELIDRYRPWILWGDIGYPPRGNLAKIFSYFYNCQPEGVVNDRWMQLPGFLANPVGGYLLDQIMKWVFRQMSQSGRPTQPRVPHFDFATTEYSHIQEIAHFKWEACRGIGKSFGYNQFETENDYAHAPDLIRLLVEIVSTNGNLLLNVGPCADGSIHPAQVGVLEEIGRWLAVNGEAIYASKPWLRHKDSGLSGGEVHYTCQGEKLFILITSLPAQRELVLPDPGLHSGTKMVHLATGRVIPWNRQGGGVTVELPEACLRETVPVLRVE